MTYLATVIRALPVGCPPDNRSRAVRPDHPSRARGCRSVHPRSCPGLLFGDAESRPASRSRLREGGRRDVLLLPRGRRGLDSRGCRRGKVRALLLRATRVCGAPTGVPQPRQGKLVLPIPLARRRRTRVGPSRARSVGCPLVLLSRGVPGPRPGSTCFPAGVLCTRPRRGPRSPAPSPSSV